MVDIIWNEGPYKFVDPIRYFKANDPYYWEVDNIPLKQLQENITWVKDQLGRFSITGIKRESLDELRPYVSGANNTARVRPGRYTARVNDAYDMAGTESSTAEQRQLQQLQLFLGKKIGELDHWNANTETLGGIVGEVLAKFKTKQIENATHMTGLVERTFTHPVIDAYTTANEWVTSPDGHPSVTGAGQNLSGLFKPPFPLSEVLLWASTENQSKGNYVTKVFDTKNRQLGFLPLATAENHMIKRWRGVFRTSIVDVPEELSIEIPRFDKNDFFYHDENGNRQTLSADVRIDLLFIFSKTIDTSATHVGKFYGGGEPTRITEATLGIVKGAGIGLDFKKLENVDKQYQPKVGITSDGVPMILANPSDELDTGAGFRNLGVHGSFPSPEDLLNKAPSLAEDAANDSLFLVGQSVLPVAYIVVRQEADINRSGQHVIPVADCIDIRPFFRTAELTYNERAGVAGALPALSLANPAVGKAHMDYEFERVIDDYKTRIEIVDRKITPHPPHKGGKSYAGPRAVGCGYIFGGYRWGVESTILDELTTEGYTTAATGHAELKSRYNLPADTIIPGNPDWDQSRWVNEGEHGSPGSYPNDYINTCVGPDHHTEKDHPDRNLRFSCYDNAGASHRASGFGTDNVVGYDNHYNIHFVKKTILIDREDVPWMQDYTVDVSLWNCFPLSSRSSPADMDHVAGADSIWVSKEANQFTIYCAWVANAHNPFTAKWENKHLKAAAEYGKFWPARQRSGHWFAGFGVMTDAIFEKKPNLTKYTGEPAVGVAIYPTVMFKITGIPNSYEIYNNLGSVNPTMALK